MNNINNAIATTTTSPKWLCCLVCFIVVLMFSVVTCNKSSENFEENPEEITDNSLPSVGVNISCSRQPPTPEGCVWALSFDALIFGDLTNIRRVDSPSVLHHWVGNPPVWTVELVEHCDGVTIPAIELDVIIKRVLDGSTRDNAEVLTVRIGSIHSDRFIYQKTT